MTKKDKDQAGDALKPVLGTGAAGDPAQPTEGTPDTTPVDPAPVSEHKESK